MYEYQLIFLGVRYLYLGIGLVPVQSTKKKRKKNNTTKQTKTIDEHNRDMKLENNNLEENTNMD